MNDDLKDLICGSCPLSDCRTESLWCLFRFVTDPNDRQKAAARKGGLRISNAITPHQRWYVKNRAKVLAKKKAQYRAKRDLALNDPAVHFTD